MFTQEELKSIYLGTVEFFKMRCTTHVGKLYCTQVNGFQFLFVQ